MGAANRSWYGVLEHDAVRAPERPFARAAGETVTYGEMAVGAAALAAGLHERGIRAGNVVAPLSHNCIEFLETILAVNFLGAIVMPINWRLAAPEVRYRPRGCSAVNGSSVAASRAARGTNRSVWDGGISTI